MRHYLCARPITPLPDIVCGSVAGARHDSAGRVEFAGSGVRLHATIRPELDRHTPSRSTADRDHSASLSLRSPLPDIVCGSVAGARHDSAGRVEFAGSGVRLHATIRPELDRHTPSRSTADRDHSASKSAPGADTGHTRTIHHSPPRRGELDDPRLRGDTECRTVRQYGSRRSPGC